MKQINFKLAKIIVLLSAVIIVLLVFVFSCAKITVKSLNYSDDNKILKQIVILSRHSVRTPLASDLDEITPNPWPHWNEKSGYLTEKGARLEGYMGKFFSDWLIEQKLLPEGCPIKEDVFVYANVAQRTIASAQAFVDKAFLNCNITVHHNNANETDPVFNPVIHNSTEAFQRLALKEMQKLLEMLKLNESYEDLSAILDYKNSDLCVKENKCNLTTDKNTIINVEVGFKPKIKGPLKICSSAIDAFVMEYYEGFKNVAWGKLNNTQEWHKIMELSRGYHNVIFNTSIIARDISKPLLEYMTEIFTANNYEPKVFLLMGHDANMYTILNGMRFKSYNLENQHERTPVGGKILFQRWTDKNFGKDFLKLNYVYQSNVQLRNGIPLSLENPPQSTLLELKDCKIDENGFCPWDDFVKLLKSL